MRKHRRLVLGATLLALALTAAACGSGGDDSGSGGGDGGDTAPKGELTVGVSGAFAENQLVAEMYAQVLEDAGYTVTRELDIESRDVGNAALESGEIDLKPEYTGYELPTLDKDADTAGTPEEVAARLQEAAAANGLTTYAFSPANSTNVFVVTQDTADEYTLTDMSSLAPVSGDLTLGGPPDCPKRDFCIPGLEDVYGIEFAEFRPLDFGGSKTVAALQSGAVQVGLLFSLDASIADNGFVALEDNENLQVAGNFVPLVREDVASAELGELLDSVTTTLTDDNMREMVTAVVIDKKDVEDVATDYLEQQGILG